MPTTPLVPRKSKTYEPIDHSHADMRPDRKEMDCVLVDHNSEVQRYVIEVAYTTSQRHSLLTKQHGVLLLTLSAGRSVGEWL